MTYDQVVDKLVELINTHHQNHTAAQQALIKYLDSLLVDDKPMTPDIKVDILRLYLNRFERKPNFSTANDNSSYLKVGNDTYAYYAQQIKK